jgi:hypothetical protein
VRALASRFVNYAGPGTYRWALGSSMRVALLLSVCIAAIAHASQPAPIFEQYSDIQPLKGQPVPVDLSSHPKARLFRTKLREGAAAGPNFAGHYSLVWWGCGNECQTMAVVDLTTGYVFGIEGESEFVMASRGVDFKLSSRLLIIDPPCPDDYNPCLSSERGTIPVRYYVVHQKGLRLVHETPCHRVGPDRWDARIECK